MPTTYEECPEEVADQADAVLRKYHGDLHDAEVSVKFLFAINPDGPAVKHKGWPAAAVIRINPLKDRVAGAKDCTLTIDKGWWEGHDDKECTALLDHEFTHLELKRDKKDDAVKTDDIGRPMLKMRKHDFEVGGFYEIGTRHGISAPEVEIVAHVQAKWIQMGLDFSGNDMKPRPEPLRGKVDSAFAEAGILE